jgi:hypothetical protein
VKTRALFILGSLLLLTLASPALAGPVRCTTYEEKTLGRLQTLCDDGTRATSYWNGTMERWETTVQPAPGARRSCSAQRHPQTRDVHVHCR